MCDFGGGGNTVTTSTKTSGGKSKSTSKVEFPSWYEKHAKSALSQAKGAAKRSYRPYDHQKRVAGFNSDINRAFDMTRDARGIWRPMLDDATGLATEAGSTFKPGNAQKWMDPYIGGVLDRAAEEFGRNRSIERGNLSDAAQQAGAFGGSRHGIVEAEFDRNTGQQVSDIYTSGLSQAYNQALQALQAEAGIGLESSRALSDLGTTQSALAYGDADAQRAIGDIQRDRAQALDDARYEEFLRKEQFPYDQAQWYAGIVSGSNVPRTQSSISTTPSVTQTQTSPGPNTGGQIIGGGLQLLGGALGNSVFSSDPKLKREIEEPEEGEGLAAVWGRRGDDSVLAKVAKLPVKRFRYKRGTGLPQNQRVGPMADDYASVFGGDGKTIDVGNGIGVLFQAVKELDRRTRKAA